MIERYNYNDEPSGRTDTLIQALEKIERLEKQLDVAIVSREATLNISTQRAAENAYLKELLRKCQPYFEALVEKRLKLEYIPRVAKLLQQIKELNNN